MCVVALPDPIAEHDRCARHRDAILTAANVGCFYCCEIYAPSKIEVWVDPDDPNLGGNLVKPNVYVFGMSGGEPHQVGQTIHETWAGSASGKLRTSVAVFDADDPACCPSAEDRNVWSLREDRWTVETSERVRLATETDPSDPDVSPRTGYFEAIYTDIMRRCRGGPGNQASTWQACDVRQAVTADLHERGRCLASESLWATCPTGYDTGADLDDCPPPTETQRVVIEDVSCVEALQVVEEAADVALTPTTVGRFTCLASNTTPPRTIWCGDYGADLTMQETTPGAIVWRTNE